MKAKQSFSSTYSRKLTYNQTMKNNLELLQYGTQEILQTLKKLSFDNPYIRFQYQTFSSSEFIEESLVDTTTSIYEKIESQITPPLFPTPKSQKVAYEILCDINSDGFFEGDLVKIANECEVSFEFIQSIRKRIMENIEPYGIGATNISESFLAQLHNIEDVNEDIITLANTIVKELHKAQDYANYKYFNEAKTLITKLNNPPAIEYLDESTKILPECSIFIDGNIEIKFNNRLYHDVFFDLSQIANLDKELQSQATNLINGINLRKSILEKIVSIIIEKQYDYLTNKTLKPLLIKEVADILGVANSTISRAVSNKYIECNHKIFSLKSFFTKNLDQKNISKQQVQNFIKSTIEQENTKKPLSDTKIATLLKLEFNLNICRRTITKYRQELKIPSTITRKI
jgi:RNA polymerase sigma-54 factor